MAFPNMHAGQARCVFTCKWYEALEQRGDDGSCVDAQQAPLDTHVVGKLRRKAEALFGYECEAFEQWKAARPSSEERWLKTVMTSGTTADRTAGMTLLVQDSPLHRLKTLASLLAMANKKHHKEAATAVETLKELFLVTLLPDRRLRTFEQACQHYVASSANQDDDDSSSESSDSSSSNSSKSSSSSSSSDSNTDSSDSSSSDSSNDSVDKSNSKNDSTTTTTNKSLDDVDDVLLMVNIYVFIFGFSTFCLYI